MTPSLQLRQLAPGESTRRFIEAAWTINARDPNWVPPLRMVMRTVLDPRKHPFHRNAEVALFLAERGGRAVGRVAAVVNRRHNEFHGERTGFFGLWECEDDPDTAAALLDAASAWLRERGMERVRGPVNLSTNEEISSPGVLVEGFDTAPFVTMSHNPPYYGALLEGAGFAKSKDVLAYLIPEPDVPERLTRMTDVVLRRHGAVVRSLDMRRFAEEVQTIQDVYNAAWSRNWGFVPMTPEEFAHIARDFKAIVDPALCLIAEIDGEAVGFSLALPDINQALRHLPDGRLFPFGLLKFLWYKRRVDALRVLTLGLVPRFHHSGLGAAMYLKTYQNGIARGYRRAEGSWILEDNLEMTQALEKMGGHVSKRYRIFERAL